MTKQPSNLMEGKLLPTLNLIPMEGRLLGLARMEVIMICSDHVHQKKFPSFECLRNRQTDLLEFVTLVQVKVIILISTCGFLPLRLLHKKPITPKSLTSILQLPNYTMEKGLRYFVFEMIDDCILSFHLCFHFDVKSIAILEKVTTKMHLCI